ncbi:hypothetical protein [Hyphococcus sp.]|uniref:hypothetical protein n=1 Tax=Hyphococcus sp. TaxID=2038636 RepID=UPI003CCB75A2
MLLKQESSYSEWLDDTARREGIEAIRESLPVRYSYSIGADIGKSLDRSVLTTIETETTDKATNHYIRDIRALPKNTNFVTQAEMIAEFMQRPNFTYWPAQLVLDGSGIGAVVSDILRTEYDLNFKKVVITSGEKRYSRNWLINTLRKWFEKPSFHISDQIRGAKELRDELEAITSEQRPSGLVYLGGKHDDYVLSAALAVSNLENKVALTGGSTDIFFSDVFKA